MTKDIGCNGNLFGGNLLAAIDEAAAIFAHITTGEERVVTVNVDQLVFKKPVKVNDIIEFHAKDHNIGRSSISFVIQVIRSKDKEEICRTHVVFVAVDENGKAKTIDCNVKKIEELKKELLRLIDFHSLKSGSEVPSSGYLFFRGDQSWVNSDMLLEYMYQSDIVIDLKEKTFLKHRYDDISLLKAKKIW
ncbi:MAG: hotdog domain-containing protein [Phenylobacterium sp.]